MANKKKNPRNASPELEKARFLEGITAQLIMAKFGRNFSVKANLGREAETVEDVALAIAVETESFRERLRVLQGGKPH